MGRKEERERERWKGRERKRERERKTSHRQVASALSEPAPYVLKIFPRYEPNEVAGISDFQHARPLDCVFAWSLPPPNRVRIGLGSVDRRCQ